MMGDVREIFCNAPILLISLTFLGGLRAGWTGNGHPGTKQFRKSVVVSGLAGPWEVTWGPDETLGD